MASLLSLLTQVNSASAEQTKALRAVIRDSSVGDAEKTQLLTTLKNRELTEFGNYFTLIDELFVSDEDYDAVEQINTEGENEFTSLVAETGTVDRRRPLLRVPRGRIA